MTSTRPKRKAVDNAEVKAKRARGETDLSNDLKWTRVGDSLKGGVPPLIVLSSDTLPGREKIASFDIDWTVIRTASGRKFATGARDWEFWDDCVPAKLKQADKDGYRIVFFTNQAGIEKGKTKADDITLKIEAIVKKLDIPVLAFVCTGENHYRKPSVNIWNYFTENCNGGVKVNKSKSIYVGDAAGRPKEWAPDKPSDFSCSDRKFAVNVGLKFQTPEEYFLGEAAAKSFKWKTFNPKSLVKDEGLGSDPKTTYHKKGQEMIIMVGPPASGKSTFTKRYLVPHGYVSVNRDTLGTAQKCIKNAKEDLKNGKSVVVDNTNPHNNTRIEYIRLAQDKGVPCRCFWMQTPFDLAHHLNMYRQTLTNGKVRRVPDVGYNVFKSHFVEPQTSEGFSEIVKLDFTPKFDSETDKKVFLQWT